MIKGSTLIKRPALVRRILVGEQTPKVEVRTIDELRFLDQNRILDKVILAVPIATRSLFARALCKAARQGSVSEGELRQWLSHPPIRDAVARVPDLDVPDILIDILSHYDTVILPLAQSLAPKALRRLYEKCGSVVAEQILRRFAFEGDPPDDLIDEIVSRETDALISFATSVEQFETRRFLPKAVSKFLELAKRDDLVGACGVCLLGDPLVRNFATAPSLLKRMAVAYRTDHPETLSHLAEEKSAEIQLILLVRGYFTKRSLTAILDRKAATSSDPRARALLYRMIRAIT